MANKEITIDDIENQIKELENKKLELEMKEAERLEAEKKERLKEVNNAYDKYKSLVDAYCDDYNINGYIESGSSLRDLLDFFGI